MIASRECGVKSAKHSRVEERGEKQRDKEAGTKQDTQKRSSGTSKRRKSSLSATEPAPWKPRGEAPLRGYARG